MDKYGKKFIRASILYLGLGVLLGLHMTFFDHALDEIRFIHVHIMLLGFMAMMIFGVAYHILPRFNAKAVLYPSWVPVHFWLANAGLWGMCVAYVFGGFYSEGPWKIFFGLFGGMVAIGIFMFIINMLHVLKDEPEEEEDLQTQKTSEDQDSRAEPEVIKLAPSMKIAEILEKYPHLEKKLTEEGFGNLSNPSARNSIAKIVSLEMAAKKAGKDLYALLAALEGKQLVSPGKGPDEGDHGPAPTSSTTPADSRIKRGESATVKTLIGPLLEIYPETMSVFETHYGSACFTCPGQQTETIEQTANMHGMAPQKILDEINAIIETAIQ